MTSQRDLVLASLKCEHKPDVYVLRPKVVALVTKLPPHGPAHPSAT